MPLGMVHSLIELVGWDEPLAQKEMDCA